MIDKYTPTGIASAGWQRLQLGGFEITVISDGPMPMLPNSGFDAAPEAEISGLLEDAFLPTDQLMLGMNCLLVNTGTQLVLIDTGMGDSLEESHMFGPSTSHMLENLAAAGVDPADIDMVLLTHAHPDHCWALTDRDGKPNFPNATVALSAADLAYWTDEANLASDNPFIALTTRGAIKNLGAYRDRMIAVTDGQEVCPGITAIASPGHSIGHTCYRVTSEGQSLIHLGDLAHHHVLALAHPDWPISYDTDPALAVASRLKILAMIAAERTQVLGYHFPWPGIGNIRAKGDAYEWAPTNIPSRFDMMKLAAGTR